MIIREFIAELPSGDVEMVEISDENGNATQMTKAYYDEQLTAQNEAAPK